MNLNSVNVEQEEMVKERTKNVVTECLEIIGHGALIALGSQVTTRTLNKVKIPKLSKS